MTRSHLLILIGALILLAPFSGLPLSWLELILPAFGLVVGGVGYSYRPRRAPKAAPPAAEPAVVA